MGIFIFIVKFYVCQEQYIVADLQRNPIKIRNKLNNEPYNKYFLAITSLFYRRNTIFAKTGGGL